MPFLDWVNKNQAKAVSTSVPYHLLQKEAEYGTPSKDNMIIQGDNLLALRALMPLYAGQVKCIFIDPPYNTQSAFEHYDDKLEHSQWLSMMYPRLVLLRDLLCEKGSIWISIDDNESHYLKVLCDEIFGRNNFVSNIIWQKIYTVKNSAKYISDMHDHVLVYAKSINDWQRNLLPRSEELNSSYTNYDNDPRGPWTTNAIQARNYYSLGSYEIVSPSGKIFSPPAGTYWRISEDNFHKLNADGRIWWGKDGQNVPRVKKFLSEAKQGVVPSSMWFHTEVGQNAEAKTEVREIFKESSEIFITPKPERLIQRVLQLATNTEDIVLDSFLGSGTTAAAAHKMNRRYIGIEMGEHAKTHCVPRLQKVIEGEQGGISKSVKWQGGGGFSFYTLNPEPVFLTNGQIRPDIKFAPLAAYIWHHETGTGSLQTMDKPYLGNYNGTAYYLLYNGVLGDRRPNSGNVLTRALLTWLLETFPHDGPKIIYGETSRIGPERLTQANVIFKQIPYDIVLR